MTGEGTPHATTTLASPSYEDYFARLHRAAQEVLSVARTARSQGWDPSLEVEVVLAEDLAARVEAQTEIPGVADLVRRLTAELNDRELVALEAARTVAAGKLRSMPDARTAIDKAVRVGLSILTEGILVAPLEGIAKVEVRKNADGSDYCDLYFAGPIRAAGGTAQAMSVLLADVVRRDLGVGRYVATEAEIERYKEEVPAYKQAQHLQYVPNAKEIELIVRNCPVCINGEGTEKEEVSGHRDLPRVETNQLRGGAVLVLAEGLTQKAAKVLKHVGKLKLEDWVFLEAFTKKKSETQVDPEAIAEVRADEKFIQELIAGRPVFAHPSRPGGFRLRLGRSRTGGIASTAIHPVVMHAVDDFLAVGTQMKLERPGKGTIATPCESIEGPIVLLDDGSLVRLQTLDEYRRVATRVRKITDLGEILIPFGEFAENNAVLPDASFTIEWWRELLRAKAGDAVAEDLAGRVRPSFEEALAWSREHGIPLHPDHDLLWHDVTVEALVDLRERLVQFGEVQEARLEWPRNDKDKELLIALNCLHREGRGRLIVDEYAPALLGSLGLRAIDARVVPVSDVPPAPAAARFPAVAWVSQNLGVEVKPRAPTRIGARMGRPEKADLRKMDPAVHGLFPLGDAGGLQRDLVQASLKTSATIEVGRRRCARCGRDSAWSRCACGGHTEPLEAPPEERAVPFALELPAALQRLRLAKAPEKVKGVVGLISKAKTPEAILKGILRAHHEVYVFKDGTSRFDLTDAPLTHFRPLEIGTRVEKLRELGYTHDVRGDELKSEGQLLELKVQDVIPSRSCGTYLVQVAKFVDSLLERVYGLPPFYKATRTSELVGHLVAGLAPHTSGAVLGRIIGFTQSQVAWAHPFFHTSKRRNCVTGDHEIWVLNSPVPRRRTLAELFDACPGPTVAVDDVGTVARAPQGLRVFAVDPVTGEVQPRKVTRLYRTPSPRHLLDVRTQAGRTLTCTPGHSLLVQGEGRLVKQRALESAEASTAVATRVALEPSTPAPIDLVEEFLRRPEPWMVVRGIRGWLRDWIKGRGGLAEAARSLGLRKKALDQYRRRDSLPVNWVGKVLQAGAPPLPREAKVGSIRDRTVLPRIIEWSPELMRFLGFYLAEGHARARPGSVFQVSIAATEEEIRDDVVRCGERAFGIRPYIDRHALTYSGRALHFLFARVLEAGAGAKTKRIPAAAMAAPAHLTRDLLRAYFAGDGHVDRLRGVVSCTSVSRGLLLDVAFQLALRGIPARLSTSERPAGGVVRAFLERKGLRLRSFTSHRLVVPAQWGLQFAREIGFGLGRKQARLLTLARRAGTTRQRFFRDHLLSDAVVSVEPSARREEFVYDLEVEEHHTYLDAQLQASSNCDGDEDALMLLMDAFLNFSKAFIPDRRGGLMDLPLVLSVRIDPREIDKEALNVDVLWRYPLAVYEASERHRPAKEVAKAMGLVEARLGTPGMYEGFGFTHDTPTIQAGPAESSYKTLGSMLEKMQKQLALAEKIRAVDAGDVAGRVLSTHLLPDVLGNLKAFAKQKLRCTKCNAKYRRVPLGGVCTHEGSDRKRCGNPLTLTVPQAGVRKYLDICTDIANRYPVPEYTRERVLLARRFVEESFAPEKFKNAKLAEFF